MNTKKIRARLHKKAKKLRRRQAVRHHIHNAAESARKRGLKAVAKQLGKISGRLHKAIAGLEEDITRLHKELQEAHQHEDGSRDEYVKWLHSVVGVDENGSTADSWAHDLGYGDTSVTPWCSITVGYGLKHHGGFEGRLPSSIAYSGSWLSWSEGTRIAYSQAQPGDLLIFDWGDGGITDHIATFVGGGQMIGGNQRDTDSGGQVSQTPVPVGNIVGVVRPHWG